MTLIKTPIFVALQSVVKTCFGDLPFLFSLGRKRGIRLNFACARLVVSGASNAWGYLPHPNQISADDCDVDSSRSCMGAVDQVLFKQGRRW